jgi:hypothetical protein
MSRDANKSPVPRIGSVRLDSGTHDSPEQGVCVVELASVIGGEAFSDRPDCVCEVIASFLRSWNDRASYSDRQRLIPYASRVVGTRADEATTRRRRDLCLAWAGFGLDGGTAPLSDARLGVRARIALFVGLRPALRLNEGAGEYAARVAFGRYDSDAAFGLLDQLLEIDRETETETVPPRPGDQRAPGRAAVYLLARKYLRGGDGVETSSAGQSLNGHGHNGNGASPNGNGHNGLAQRRNGHGRRARRRSKV